jgi:hypothetical protein
MIDTKVIDQFDLKHLALCKKISDRADHRGIAQASRALQSHGFGGYGVLIEELWALLNDSVNEFETLKELHKNTVACRLTSVEYDTPIQ